MTKHMKDLGGATRRDVLVGSAVAVPDWWSVTRSCRT